MVFNSQYSCFQWYLNSEKKNSVFIWWHHLSEGKGRSSNIKSCSHLYLSVSYFLSWLRSGIHRWRNVSFEWNLWNAHFQWIYKRHLKGLATKGFVKPEQFPLPLYPSSLILTNFSFFSLLNSRISVRNFGTKIWKISDTLVHLDPIWKPGIFCHFPIYLPSPVSILNLLCKKAFQSAAGVGTIKIMNLTCWLVQIIRS